MTPEAGVACTENDFLIPALSRGSACGFFLDGCGLIQRWSNFGTLRRRWPPDHLHSALPLGAWHHKVSMRCPLLSPYSDIGRDGLRVARERRGALLSIGEMAPSIIRPPRPTSRARLLDSGCKSLAKSQGRQATTSMRVERRLVIPGCGLCIRWGL